MNTAIQEVLDKVVDACRDEGLLREENSEKRFSLNGDAEAIDWLQNLKISEEDIIPIWNAFQIVRLKYNGNEYLAIINNSSHNIFAGLTAQPLNPGVWCAIVYELKLKISKQQEIYQSYNKIYAIEPSGEKGLCFCDYTEIEHCFPSIDIYQIDNSVYPVDTDIHKLACLFLSENGDKLQLPFSQDVLNAVQTLCNGSLPLFRYENLFQALTANNFKYAFLDIYRTYEMLYQWVYIEEALTNAATPVAISKEQLLEIADETLLWKPIERNSLTKILNGLRPQDVTVLIDAIKSIASLTSSDNCVYWNWLYDTRCNIVHLKKSNHKYVSLTDDQWNNLLRGFLISANAVYAIHN